MTLLDRENERADIDRFLNDKSNAQVRVLLLHGGKGAGKSDLLRYAVQRAGSRALDFDDGTRYLRCREGDHERDFSMLEPLVGALSLRHPKLFSRALGKTRRQLALPPLAELLVTLAASVKYLGSLETVFRTDLEEGKTERERLMRSVRDSHAMSRIRGFLVKSLAEEFSARGGVLLAFDNAAWLDQLSIRTLLSACRELLLKRQSQPDIIVAFGGASGADSPAELRSTLADYPEVSVTEVVVSNLSFDDTSLVVRTLGRNLSYTERRLLYEATKGNFRELQHLLSRKDQELRILLQSAKVANSGPERVSLDLVRKRLASLAVSNPAGIGVLGCILLLGNLTEIRVVRAALRTVLDEEVRRPLTDEQLHEILRPLSEQGLVQIVGHQLVGDPHALAAVRSLMLQDGTYERVARSLVKALVADGLAGAYGEVSARATAVRILNEVAPAESLDLYSETSDMGSFEPAPTRTLLLGLAGGLQRTGLPEADRELYVAVKLLGDLTRFSCFDAGVELGNELYTALQRLPQKQRHQVLGHLLTCKRESGRLDDEPPLNDVTDQLIATASSEVQAARARLLICPSLEHAADYDRIRSEFQQVRKFLETTGDARLRLEYQRNLGLAEFHGDVASEYQAALEGLEDLEVSSFDRTILAASLMNHLGLAAFHTGDVEGSLAHFEESLEVLRSIGVREETPLNNLGSAHIFLGNLKSAFDLLEAARDVPLKPAYQACSIDMNLSLCLFKLGNADVAKSLIEPLATGNRSYPDPAVLSHARANYAYLLLCEGNYHDASRYFVLSKEHSFRFLEQERALIRERLATYCAGRAGLLVGQDLGDMSFIDFDESGTLPVRRPYQLDLNSLYVV